MQPEFRYKPGEILNGKYLVHDARMGGMSEVYLCLDLRNEQPYALKTLKQAYTSGLGIAGLGTLFRNELTTWLALEKHPNIVRCFELEFLDDLPFMRLEWIMGDDTRGNDLRSWISFGSLDLQRSLQFTLDICNGLMFANDKQPGFVHRDLKPENIMVNGEYVAKITDFGLAKIVQSANLNLPQIYPHPDGRQHLSGLTGTPAYMAPEQWTGQPLDFRTDIYAIGCILYELVVGKRLFDAPTLDGLKNQHLVPNHVTFPNNLQNILQKCLSLRPDDRFSSIRELFDTLTQFYYQRFNANPRQLKLDQEFTVEDYTNRGMTYLHISEKEKALRDFDTVINLEPDSRLSYRFTNRAIAEFMLLKFDSALSDHTRAIEVDPLTAHNYSNRAGLYKLLNKAELALNDYTKAISLDPNNVSWYLSRGKMFLELKKYQESLRDFNNVCQLSPSNMEAHVGLGCAYAELGNLNEAIKEYSLAINLDPTVSQIYSDRGLAEGHLGMFDRAIADHNRAISLDPDKAVYYYNRGIAFAGLGKFKDAYDDFSRTIKLDESFAPAYCDRGLTLVFMHNSKDAYSNYKKAIELDPTYGLTYLNLGILLENRGAVISALSFFQQAASLGQIEGSGRAAQLLQRIGAASPDKINPLYRAMDAFLLANSLNEMSEAVKAFPIIISKDFLTAYENKLQQLDEEQRAILGERLSWAKKCSMDHKQGAPGTQQMDLTQMAFKAFQTTSSLDAMQTIVKQYPFMKEDGFIQAIERTIKEQVPPNLKPAFEQRLAWLKQITGKQNSGFLSSLFGKK